MLLDVLLTCLRVTAEATGGVLGEELWVVDRYRVVRQPCNNYALLGKGCCTKYAAFKYVYGNLCYNRTLESSKQLLPLPRVYKGKESIERYIY